MVLRADKEGSFHEVDLTILNVYAPNNRAANYVMQNQQQNNLREMKGEVDEPTITTGENPSQQL